MGDALSAGLGVALGLVMGQHMLQTLSPGEKVTVKRVIVCQECYVMNPIRNKFCNNCGQALYPPPQAICSRCNSRMPVTMNFCGDCGSPLQR